MTTHDTAADPPQPPATSGKLAGSRARTGSTAQDLTVAQRARVNVQSARDEARARIMRAITDVARQHLSDVGPANLSLRAVARDLTMASSAVYRYFKNRDELLTALIVDAYNDLGEVAERTANSLPADLRPRQRWIEVAMAVRAWAVEHPHEFGLIYGSPIPGYAGPDDTHTAASRMPLALVGVVRDAVNEQAFHPPSSESGHPEIPGEVLAQEVREIVTGLDDDVIVQLVKAWAGLLGVVSFEIFGYLGRVITDPERYFRSTADQVAWELGLD
ncbi:TetR/AcrR family transcriptional regulator [Natronoglycomyces albus]|uniref:TetR/AcrR family transcriptional regulator n=1 Tax=Natronoglycomyces albus TaxID=2811108 RepID=A0A895XPC2_9ACTN|nr:TetR/AcrR family transcriptional regulator [Natronoglycomyces albus]QSB05229.1 TetR/AcrR family transcriptional regulator [Natronoglycomyces albus]